MTAQSEAFAALAAADPEAFKAVVNLAVDFGIFRDAMRAERLTAAGEAALTAADGHANAAVESVAALAAAGS